MCGQRTPSANIGGECAENSATSIAEQFFFFLWGWLEHLGLPLSLLSQQLCCKGNSIKRIIGKTMVLVRGGLNGFL